MMILISLILILISLIIIIVIVVRKFPVLAILDVENISKEKEAKFKDMIVKARLDRDLAKFSGFFGNIFLKINTSLGHLLKRAQDNLSKIKLKHEVDKDISYQKKEKRLKDLKRQADEFIKAEKFAEAENNLVAIISLDQKNLSAFFKLGEVYEELRKYPEARQTYEYALKLSKVYYKERGRRPKINPQEIYFSLAQLEKKAGNIAAAYDNILEALEIEPSSPRFLDLILDLSIIKKDKAASWQIGRAHV